MNLVDGDVILEKLREIPIDLGYREIADAIKVVEGAPSAWISVKDRLPEEDGLCLVYDGEGGSVMILSFTRDMSRCFSITEHFNKRPGWYRRDFEWGDIEYPGVTHWMQLPPPPEPPKES